MTTVSVPMVTFRHARFLAQAIESVLSQDLADWELVIGDDASDDDTLEVARRYQREHPERIRVLTHETRQGGRANYVRTLRACRGRYVSQLDGDDAWLSPRKLSSQVAHLEAHPEHAFVFCASRKVFDDPRRDFDWFPPGRKPEYALADLIEICPTGSGAVMFRRELLGDDFPPAWFWNAPVGDWPLHCLNARHGPAGYIDVVMMFYRQHGAGVWSGLGALEQHRVQMRTRDCIHANVAPELTEPYERATLRDRVKEAGLLHELGEVEEARATLLAAVSQPRWYALSAPADRVRAARELERLGAHREARDLLARLLREDRRADPLPRARLWKRWMRCSLLAALTPAGR